MDITSILEGTIYDEEIGSKLYDDDLKKMHSIMSESATNINRNEIIQNAQESNREPVCLFPIVLSPEIFPVHLMAYQRISRFLKDMIQCIIIFYDAYSLHEYKKATEKEEQIPGDLIERYLNIHKAALKAMNIDVENKNLKIIKESDLFTYYFDNNLWRRVYLNFDANALDQLVKSPYYMYETKDSEGSEKTKKIPVIRDAFATCTTFIFCLEPHYVEKSPTYLFVGTEKYNQFELLLTSLVKKFPELKEKFKTQVIYVPAREIFFDISKGDQYLNFLTSKTDIRKILENFPLEEIKPLATYHDVNTHDSNDLVEVANYLAEFYDAKFSEIRKESENDKGRFEDEKRITNIDDFIIVIRALKKELSWLILKEIFKYFQMNDSENCIASKIANNIGSHLSSILPRINELNKAGLITEYESNRPGRGGGYYKPSCKALNIAIDLTTIKNYKFNPEL